MLCGQEVGEAGAEEGADGAGGAVANGAAVDGGGKVRGINAKGAADNYSRKGIDELTNYVVGDFGAKGLAWFKVGEGKRLASPIAKNFSDELLAKIAEREKESHTRQRGWW